MSEVEETSGLYLEEQLCPYKSVKTKGFVVKPSKNPLTLKESDYDSLSREELVTEVIRLTRHLNQLKNSLTKANAANSKTTNTKPKRFDKNPFDFEKYNKRHIFIKFLYLGWDYKGYITQEHTSETIEHHLFEALKITKLIESRETSNYHRCGRTDIGVSAFSQIASIDVRSNCTSGVGVVTNEKSKVTNDDIEKEINYTKLLNGALPDDIRVICWSPVDNEMSARFDCNYRSYRYYFPKGDLNLDAINEAGKRMMGQHDFRNFCKMDVSNGVVTFFRDLKGVRCHLVDTEAPVNKYSTVELIIEANSFLWHQIRCIVSILLLVGQGREDPSVVTELLNVEKNPCKPQYSMASELPLVLFDCQYDNVKEWRYDHLEMERLIKKIQDAWVEQNTRATVAKRMIDYLEGIYEETKKTFEDDGKNPDKRKNLTQTYSVLMNQVQYATPGRYVKLLDRLGSASLEKRIDHYVKKRRLDADVYNKLEENKKLAGRLNIHGREAEREVQLQQAQAKSSDMQSDQMDEGLDKNKD